MITLYLEEKAIDGNLRFINSIDLTFDKEIYNFEITDKDQKMIRLIDHAEYIGDGYILTPFGKTEIQRLSTGCKTVLLINHSEELGNPIINIGECGKNVLDIIFGMNNIKVYLNYCSIPNKYDTEKEIKVISSRGSKTMKLVDVFNRAWGD